MADVSKRRAELEAALAALDDEDPGEDEVTIRRGEESFTGSWRRAMSVAKSWGFSLIPETLPEPDEEPPAKKGKSGAEDTVKRFAGRRIS